MASEDDNAGDRRAIPPTIILQTTVAVAALQADVRGLKEAAQETKDRLHDHAKETSEELKAIRKEMAKMSEAVNHDAGAKAAAKWLLTFVLSVIGIGIAWKSLDGTK